MKFGVIVFPGSNCDMDMIYVLNSILKKKVIPLWHKDTDLQECDFIILPGGFSFGDYLRSGAIAKFSPIMKEIIGFANARVFLIYNTRNSKPIKRVNRIYYGSNF